ncbi:glycosyltransferase [bacterium]|nr:glycosyltransferase [bacterium]
MKKFKIAHFINNLERNGAQVLLVDLLNYLDKEKFDVYVFYFHSFNNFSEEAGNSKIKFIDLSDNGKFSIKSVYRLYKLLKYHNFDILHTHLVQASLITKIISLFCEKKIRVSTRHFCGSAKSKTLTYRLENFLSRILDDEVWAISKAVLSELIENNFKPEKVKLVYNSIVLQKFSFTQRPTKVSFFNVGGIGRLNKLKRYKELGNAFIKLKKKYPQMFGKLILIGDGPERENIQTLFETEDLSESLEITGFLPTDILCQKSTEIDIFVQPSEWEGFGLSVAEAMALGIPCVCSDVGGIPEIVEENVNGFLFKETSEIETKILQMAQNPEKQNRFSQNGRNIVEEKFSIENNIKVYENRYLELLKNI